MRRIVKLSNGDGCSKLRLEKTYVLARSLHARWTGQSTWQRCVLWNKISSLSFALNCYVIITCNAKCENERVKYFDNYKFCSQVWYSSKFAFETIYNIADVSLYRRCFKHFNIFNFICIFYMYTVCRSSKFDEFYSKFLLRNVWINLQVSGNESNQVPCLFLCTVCSDIDRNHN